MLYHTFVERQMTLVFASKFGQKMIGVARLSLVQFPSDKDPRETHNLWDDSDYAAPKAALSLPMIEYLQARMDQSLLAKRRT